MPWLGQWWWAITEKNKSPCLLLFIGLIRSHTPPNSLVILLASWWFSHWWCQPWKIYARLDSSHLPDGQKKVKFNHLWNHQAIPSSKMMQNDHPRISSEFCHSYHQLPHLEVLTSKPHGHPWRPSHHEVPRLAVRFCAGALSPDAVLWIAVRSWSCINFWIFMWFAYNHIQRIGQMVRAVLVLGKQ